jgi:diguanylate cyclase (GGDEF)-like protein
VSQTGILLQALAKGAEALSHGSGWPENVDTLLAELGRATGVSRVWIFQNMEVSENSLIHDYVTEWTASPRYSLGDVPSMHMFQVDAENREYWKIIQERKRGEHQDLVIADLPDCWLRAFLQEQGVLSMLTFPVMVDGQWWGVLGLDDCEREKRWEEEEISVLRAAVCMLSNSILRSRLHAHARQFAILQRITDSLTWEYDFIRNRIWLGGHSVNTGRTATGNSHSPVRTLLHMFHPEDRRPFLQGVQQYIDNEQGTFRHDIRFRRKGSWVWAEVIGTLERDDKGRPVQLAGIALDIRRRKREEMHLAREARLDPLTGISNRRTFDHMLEHHLNRAEDAGGDLSLLLIDFDRFKQINDTWGHSVGDMVLKKFVNICSDCLRSDDVLARIGGEEFAIILPGATSRAAIRVGERIRLAVEELNLLLEAGAVSFTISIGCVTKNKKHDTPDAFVLDADKALYKAKHNGRNCVVKGD